MAVAVTTSSQLSPPMNTSRTFSIKLELPKPLQSSIMALLGVVLAVRSSPHFPNSARSSPNLLSFTQILMNAHKQHSIFDTHQLFIFTEMVKGWMRCLALGKSGCTIACGCTPKGHFVCCYHVFYNFTVESTYCKISATSVLLSLLY